jgi:DNA-binding IclR family transcriptional regulator
MSMAEVQRTSGLNRTMTFRLLRALRELDYLELDAETRRYDLGVKLLHLGRTASDRSPLVRVAAPVLVALRDEFDETMNLGVLTGVHVSYLAMVESQRGLRMAAVVGGQDIAHATSLGKAILAWSPPAVQESYLALTSWPNVTEQTIADPVSLRGELERVRWRGYAIDEEENEAGARCIGVPLLDGTGIPIAGLSASGPASRIKGERIDAIGQGLATASEAIARRLGYRATNGSAPIEDSPERKEHQ